jgi:hypothetical protein
MSQHPDRRQIHLSSLPAMAESLQQLILDHLDANGALSDSRTITIPGAASPATDADSQITVLGALNSLLSREVSDYLSVLRVYPFPNRFPLDDPLRAP